MINSDMLRCEVARRLANEGLPADAEAVSQTIDGLREDCAAVLSTFALNLVACTNTGCGCLVAATVYNAVATEIREAA